MSVVRGSQNNNLLCRNTITKLFLSTNIQNFNLFYVMSFSKQSVLWGGFAKAGQTIKFHRKISKICDLEVENKNTWAQRKDMS